jgi:hypothetical protein
VQRPHEHVVGVARLLAKADPAVGRAHRVIDDAPAALDPPARAEEAQAEVGVLAVRAREPLVEAADRSERLAAERHVRRRPDGPLEPGDVALPIRRPPAGGCGNAHDTLRCGHIGRGADEVRVQPRAPAGRRRDVVVEERDPLCA